ncbi:hypothetical protein [Staphylococcus equorum]|uniref:hypothetical protein n=1 Tax=Staphylococcus equorum TaxID=246432 RepID=UPI00085356FB|nr:hypothetical protein [Staphylococcus equorum]OEK60612.1 hypothetical protein ASS99_11155 [Staphylococcus equorum]
MEFKVGDTVFINDSNCLEYNDYYELEKAEQLKLNNEYKVIDYETRFDDEVLYLLKDINTKAICGAMVSEWSIEKVEDNGSHWLTTSLKNRVNK